MERELGAIQTASNDLAKNAQISSQTPEEAIKSLEGIISRVEGLKRKVGLHVLPAFALGSPGPVVRSARNCRFTHVAGHAREMQAPCHH
jgi:hypothetical protein